MVHCCTKSCSTNIVLNLQQSSYSSSPTLPVFYITGNQLFSNIVAIGASFKPGGRGHPMQLETGFFHCTGMAPLTRDFHSVVERWPQTQDEVIRRPHVLVEDTGRTELTFAGVFWIELHASCFSAKVPSTATACAHAMDIGMSGSCSFGQRTRKGLRNGARNIQAVERCDASGAYCCMPQKAIQAQLHAGIPFHAICQARFGSKTLRHQ